MVFQHQQPSANGFIRRAPEPQQVGVRLKPAEKTAETAPPKRPSEQRAFREAS